MATNTQLSVDQIAYETLRIIKNRLVAARNINREYNDYFKNTGAPRNGSTITVKKPFRAISYDGFIVPAQTVEEGSTTVNVSTVKSILLNFGQRELSLDIEDISKQYLEPAAAKLVNDLDVDIIRFLTDNLPNKVGSFDEEISYETFIDALTRLKSFEVFEDNTIALLSQISTGSLLKSNVNNFNPSEEISKIWKKAVIAEIAGIPVLGSSNIVRKTVTGDYTGTVDGANQVGTVLKLSSVANLEVGNSIAIEGVEAINPMSRNSLGFLRHFVIKAINTVDNTVQIYPGIYDLAASKQEHNVTALAANGANVIRVEEEGTGSYNLVYNKDCATLVTVDLEKLMSPYCSVVSDKETGISIRIHGGADLTNSQDMFKLSIMYGFGMLYEDFGVVMLGK